MPRKKSEKPEAADGTVAEKVIEDSSQRAPKAARGAKPIKYNGDLKEAAGKVIQSLSTTYNSLDGISIVEAIETDTVIVLAVERGQGARVVGKEGSIVKMISKELGKPVKVVEAIEKRDKRRTELQVRGVLDDLLKPAALLGINILYAADGGEELRVRVPLKDRPFVQITPDSFEEVMRHISGLSMKLVFEER